MENDLDSLTRVFVYGTLKQGQPNYFHLEKQEHGISRFIGHAVTEKRYPLVISTRWNIPFLLYKPGFGEYITGDICTVDKQLLNWLDDFEGHPDMYVREKINVRLLSKDSKTTSTTTEINDETVDCWVYFFKKFPENMLKLEMYSNYNAYDSHNKLYKPDEDLCNASNIDEELKSV